MDKTLKLIRKELEKSNKLSIDRETDSEKLRRGINNLRNFGNVSK